MFSIPETRRLVAYWGTVVVGLWALAFFIGYKADQAKVFYKKFGEAILIDQNIEGGNAAIVGSAVVPFLFISSLATLLVTSSPLPMWRTAWITHLAARIRQFPTTPAKERQDLLQKINQYGVGEFNMNRLAIFLVLFPSLGHFLVSEYFAVIATDKVLTASNKIKKTGEISGVAAVIALAFFLVPVTRHSVLLAALGWSPFQALRLHIWAGYVAFGFTCFHTICFIVYWFYQNASVVDQIFPKRDCWTWNPPPKGLPKYCGNPFHNISGIINGIFFLVLLLTSLDWVRRRWYRVFYVFHVTFGSATLLTLFWHWPTSILMLMPSLLYYLAGTTPTLVHALASRFRKGGGVRIVKVVHLASENHRASTCTEVHLATDAHSQALLQREACLVVKVCVPRLSLVWHPFTVYPAPHSAADEKQPTVRFVFRSVGPFTKALEQALTNDVRPVTLVDGFYRGGDRVSQALQHDHVTIIAGGVALSPFLSLLQNLLSQLLAASKGSDVLTISVVLHWVCREEELIHYMQAQYLSRFLAMAQQVLERKLLPAGWFFKIHIHHTGTPSSLAKESALGDETERTTQAGDLYRGSSSSSNEKEEIPAVDGSTNAASSSSSNEKEEILTVDGSTKAASSSTANEKEEIPVVDGSTKAVSTAGHDLEASRLMAGQYEQVRHNLPLFLILSVPIWAGYRVIVYWFFKRDLLYSKQYRSVWPALVTLLVVVGWALIVEGVAPFLVRFWPGPPAPRLDEFDLEEWTAAITDPEKGGDETDRGADCIQLFHHRLGRPSANVLLAEAAKGRCPGVFLCGPVGLVDQVRGAAAQENQVGLTRYCLYEESFEM